MGFRKSIIAMLKHCIEESLVRYEDVPLARLSYPERRTPYVINITDADGSNVMYSYDRFIEIFSTKGLDGFAF